MMEMFSQTSSLSVLDAIDPTEGWESNDTMHLISLRGSKLLASSSSGGNYATATREFERQFQIASILYHIATEDKRDSSSSNADRGGAKATAKANAKSFFVFLDDVMHSYHIISCVPC